MLIRLLSDLHAEGGIDKELYKSQGEDVLVIAGDLHVGADNVWDQLKTFAVHQPNIVFVYGNHEFYKQYYYNTITKIEAWAKNTSIKILNPGTVYYNNGSLSNVEGDIAFIGGTLWTNFRNNELSKLAAQQVINDFRLIEVGDGWFTPSNAVDLFQQHAGYIKHQYEAIKSKKVIVTHFLPAVECIDSKYTSNQYTNTLNDYFANDLGDWISVLEDTIWLHGHTHDNVDIMLGDTRVVANPYGYGKNMMYKECLIEV